MIVFQVKGQSHSRTLKGKEKDVIKIFLHIAPSTPKTAKSSKIKAWSSRPCTNCSLYRCAYDVHNYDAQQHTAGQIISPLTLQTITTAQMLSVGREGRGGCADVVLRWRLYAITDVTLSISLATAQLIRAMTNSQTVLSTHSITSTDNKLALF